MTPETVVQIIRQALMTTFWLAAPLLVDRLRGGHRDQPGADRDFDAGQRLQHHPAPGRVPGRTAVSDALDAAANDELYHFDTWRSGSVCQVACRIPTWLFQPVRCTRSCWCWRAWAERWCSFRCLESEGAPEPVRAALALGFTLALFGQVAGRGCLSRGRGDAGRLGSLRSGDRALRSESR